MCYLSTPLKLLAQVDKPLGLLCRKLCVGVFPTRNDLGIVGPDYGGYQTARSDLGFIGVEEGVGYQMHDLLTGARYLWNGRRNFVSLDPARVPAHVFRVRRRVHTERDFDYFG